MQCQPCLPVGFELIDQVPILYRSNNLNLVAEDAIDGLASVKMFLYAVNRMLMDQH